MLSLLRLWGWLPIPYRLRWGIVSLFVPKFAVGVAGVIFNEREEILLFRHTYRGQRFPWGLPGGWLDAREDPAQGIVREIFEETGLEVTALHPMLIETALLVRRLDVLFLCRLEGGLFRPSAEVDAVQFFCRDSLPAMLITQRQMIEKLFDLVNSS